VDRIRVIRSLFPRFAVPSDADYKQHKGENQTQRGGHVTQFHNEFLPRRAARRARLPGCDGHQLVCAPPGISNLGPGHEPRQPRRHHDRPGRTGSGEVRQPEYEYSIRTVQVPEWVKRAVDDWTQVAGITTGFIFRAVSRNGKLWGDHITPKAIWHVVKGAARQVGIANLAPHDLRRSCARLCHLAGGELEQIQFLLGHVSVQTTERYLGCKQRLRNAVNDGIDLAEA